MNSAARQQVGFATTLSLVVGSIIGVGIFVVPASLAPLGWNAPFGWVVSSSGALCLAFALATLTRGGEGIQSHIQYELGPTAGFIAAWSFWCCCWASIAIVALAAATALSRINPQLADPAVATPLAISFVVILTFVNAMGIRSAGRMQVLTTLIKVIPLVAVILLFALRSGRGEPAQPLAQLPLSFDGVAMASALTLFALTGFENATTPVGKVSNCRRNIPLAMMIGTLLVAMLYLLSSTSVLFLLPSATVSVSTAPFADALAVEWGEGAVVLAATCIAVSALGGLNANVLASGELAYAMAVRNDLPRFFGRTRTDGTPVVAQCIAGAFGIGLILLAANRGGESIFTFIILVTTVGNLMMYLPGAIAAFRADRRPVARLIICIAGVFIFFSFYGAGLEANLWGLLMVVCGLALRAAGRFAAVGRTVAETT